MYIVSQQEFTIGNLPDMMRIDYRRNNTGKESLDKWWKDNFSRPPLIGMEVDKVDSCKEIVLKGLGYAFLPEGIWEETDKIYKIPMIDKMGKPLVRKTWMIYREDNLKITLVKTFIDFVNSWKETC
jgi:DNA-binding transcriptional LysR family regulator